MATLSLPSSFVSCSYDGQDRSKIPQDTTHVNVGESLEELPTNALRDLYLLVQVNLPQGLRVIGKSAFQFCSNLKLVTFPDSLQEIRDHAFEYCHNLSSSCGTSNLLDLTEGITIIGDQAFAMSCESIQYLQLPSTLKILGRGSFSHWSALVSVGLHEEGKLKTIGDYAFYGASALRSIAIPSTVTYVGRWAFGRCHQLQSDVCACMLDSRDETVEKAVRTRFEGLPLHKMVYFDGGTSELELIELMTSGSTSNNGLKCDNLGMTPLDILMFAPRPNYDLVPLFVQHFPETAFVRKAGSTPTHYACSRKAPVDVIETLITAHMKYTATHQSRQVFVEPPHWTSLVARAHQSDAMEILQLILRLQYNDRIDSLRLGRWKQDIQDTIHQLSTFSEEKDRTERLVLMETICKKVQIYQQMEAISNLELSVWKICIRRTEGLQKNNPEGVGTKVNREHCRVYSGSECILSNVIPFLYEVAAAKSRSHSPVICQY